MGGGGARVIHIYFEPLGPRISWRERQEHVRQNCTEKFDSRDCLLIIYLYFPVSDMLLFHAVFLPADDAQLHTALHNSQIVIETNER